MTSNGKARSHGARVLPWLLAVVFLAIAAVAGVKAYESLTAPRPSTMEDMEGNRIALDDGDVPTDSQKKDMNATDPREKAPRLKVPAHGLNVGIGEISATSSGITPPSFTSAYHVRNRGAKIDQPGKGRVFLVTHSASRGVAPGNYLRKVKTGETVIVGKNTYTVTGVRHVSKPKLAQDAQTWKNEPKTLAIITCLQRPSGPSRDNLVITAKESE